MADQLIVDGIWFVSTVILFIVAWQNFNEPPTNRSSTTFLLFLFGVTVYYTSLLIIWMILIETLKSGGLAIIGLKISNHSVGEMINVIAPLIAALLVLAGGYSKRLKEIDKHARSYCLKLASIPGEANWLTQELAERTAYNRNERIASALLPELMARENVDACAAQGHETPRLENARERFFDAVYLYSVVCLPPLTNAMHQPLYQDPLGSKYRGYLPVNKDLNEQARLKYKTLIDFARKYFASPAFHTDLSDKLERRSDQLFKAVCGLISRIVLHEEMTERRRQKKLNELGFQYAKQDASFGRDQLSAIVVASFAILFSTQFAFTNTTGNSPQRLFFLAILVSLQSAISVYAGTRVAYHALSVRSSSTQWPPLWPALIGGLISAAVAAPMTLIFLTFSGLEAAGSLSQAIVNAVVRFEHRSWAWMMFPFLNCVGTALTSYMFGNSLLGWKRLSAIGAAAWAGWFLISALFPISLVQDYQTEKLPILITMGILGVVFGAFILPVFRMSLQETVTQPDAAGPVRPNREPQAEASRAIEPSAIGRRRGSAPADAGDRHEQRPHVPEEFAAAEH